MMTGILRPLLIAAIVLQVCSTADAQESAQLLPDTPSATLLDTPAAEGGAPRRNESPVAPKYAVVVEPGYIARPLSAKDKVTYGARELISLPFFVNSAISASLSQGLDSDPLYGRDGTAFAQRLGAAFARNSSQYVFTDMVLHPLFHTDPRYHALGPGHNFGQRFWYAATRTVVARTDSGRSVPNLAMIGGYGATAAMTPLYYPPRSSNAQTALSAWGLSLGGKAIGYELVEFFRFLVPSQPKR